MASRRTPDAPRRAEAAPISDPARPPKARKPLGARPAVTPEARRAMIAENAYLRAERRGFVPGYETEDWLAAEAEVDALLRVGHGGSPQ
jgi:Protein of unknown function (DUF2934)